MGTEMTPMDDPILVLDFVNSAELPRNFRTTNDAYLVDKAPPVTRFGLDRLNASAARQFSELDLLTSLSGMTGQGFIVDLRQESHGFANGSAISWYGFLNDSNLGKSGREIADLEQRLTDDISARGTIELNTIVRKSDGHIAESSTRQIRVLRAETEKTLVERVGLNYVRLPVTDHQHPDPETLNHFVDFVRGLPDGAWVHFHCRSGKGRSSTFMVLYDIFHNAGDVCLDDIICRNALLGSKDVSRVSDLQHKAWKNQMARDRHELVANFYAYMTDSHGYGRVSCSEWLAQQRDAVG